MNKLILFLSIPSKEQKEKPYKSDRGVFSGINSSDAPSKYILQYAHSENNPLDEIICIVTEKSKENNNFENYKELISKYCMDKNISVPQIKEVLYSDNISQTVTSITENIQNEDNIFIDTTGGFRDTSYILLFVVRFLECIGTNFKKAIYVNYYTSSITDVTSTYKLFNLINGADNFISFGDSKALSEIFVNTKNQHIKDLIQSMNDFSDAISLCRTKNIDKIVKDLNDNLNALKNNIDINDSYELLFYQMTDLIKQKFHLEDKSSFDYLNIINWCLDNNLIQQAITIYTDKIPTYLIQNQYFECLNQDILKKAEKTKNKDCEILYNGLLKMELKSCSLNPLKSLLGDDDIISILKKSKDLDVFKKNLADIKKIDFDIPEIGNLISNIFILKRDMFKYNNKSKKYEKQKNIKAYLENKYGNNSVLAEASEKLDANDFNGMINQIKSNQKVFNNLTRKGNDTYIEEINPKEDTINSKISVIENLDTFLESNKSDYKVNISTKEFQSILRDCLYIKRWIRNVINHAGDECSISDDEKNYYKNQGYSIDEDLSRDDIIKIMRKVLDKVKDKVNRDRVNNL